MKRRGPEQAAPLRTWLDHVVLPRCAERILPVDAAAAFRCAAMHVPDTRYECDALTAATARVDRMAVVTRNLAGFEGRGVDLLDLWALQRWWPSRAPSGCNIPAIAGNYAKPSRTGFIPSSEGKACEVCGRS